MASRIIRHTYRTVRSVVFATLLTIAGIYLGVYGLVSLPWFQNKVARSAEKELSVLLGGELKIGKLMILPFSEIQLKEVSLADRGKDPCIRIASVGAGIDIWRLITEGIFDISYVEIVGLDGRVEQAQQDGKLNIDFLIEALKPKDKKKAPTHFQLVIRRATIRGSRVSFIRSWTPPSAEGRLDFNRLLMTSLDADMRFPFLSDNSVRAEVSRLNFTLQPGLKVNNLRFRADYDSTSLTLSDFLLETPGSRITLSALPLRMTEGKSLVKGFETGNHLLQISDATITLSDFSSLLPSLRDLNTPWKLDVAVSGNLKNANLDRLSISSSEQSTNLVVQGSVENPMNPGQMKMEIKRMQLTTEAHFVNTLPWLNDPKITRVVNSAGKIDVEVSGRGDSGRQEYEVEGSLATDCGAVDFEGKINGRGSRRNDASGKLVSEPFHLQANLGTEDFDVGRLLSTDKIGKIAIEGNADFLVGKGIPEGEGSITSTYAEIMGNHLSDIRVEVSNRDKMTRLSVDSDDPDLTLRLAGVLDNHGESPELEMNLNVERIVPSAFRLLKKYEGYEFSTRLMARVEGLEPERMTGYAMFYNTRFSHPQKGEGVALDIMRLTSTEPEPGRRHIELLSDWADLSLMVKGMKMKTGKGEMEKMTGMKSSASAVDYKGVINAFRELLAQTLPLYADETRPDVRETNQGEELEAELSLTLKASPEIYEFFRLPLFPLGEGKVNGFFSSISGEAEVSAEFPYIQQGRDKLIERTRFDAVLNRKDGTVGLDAFTHYPAKKGDMDIELQVLAREGSIYCDAGFNRGDPQALLHGTLGLNAHLDRDPLTRAFRAGVTLLPSRLDLKGRPWQIERGIIGWKDNKATVEHLYIHSGKQFLSIDGVASASEEDMLKVDLAGIDVGAIFEVLNINYVTFGGIATGQAVGRALLSKEPVLTTNGFSVASLSYNGSVLGDAELRSRFIASEKKVTIGADVANPDGRKANIDGGIWIGRDSLSFDIDADRIDVGFMSPFVSAFATDLRGRASGKAKLFGTFSDIDLTGRLFADTIALRLLSTNVVYAGSDSVFMDRGRISIPSFRLYDRNGNSALLSGELRHRYFHDPEFEFRLLDASNLLCYDIGPNDNPDWYGTIYGTGTGLLTGRPGLVSVDVDMTTNDGSTFAFVLSDRESAEEFSFLTFTDKRKERQLAEVVDSTPSFLRRFLKKREEAGGSETQVMLDFRATVTPLATVTLVMDPEGGDKITCHGEGPLQMTYNSATSDLRMYGKYTLDDGIYNFTLQDIILKDFTIRPGSSIAFNGDPLAADLNISATYRVNTSLTDLDQSFANDRELNRTNVPVEAVLNVAGRMTNPDITFDIELPTLTSDVERKVKSLISTEDMMSRQIIYLLALNRFYTPEYTGAGSSTGSELTSVASSTLSSQLSNMLSRMTDLVSVAPSIRSEKGDFSDMEVDLALSSRLLDNRLLINGNFGYRDRGTSSQSTQFIGDFDIEYLLNKSGNLRLKAYNRFNDQNYYLRQALTTQGIGLVVRRDFDNLLSFLRPFRKKKESAPLDGEESEESEDASAIELRDPEEPEEQEEVEEINMIKESELPSDIVPKI
ncbi:MAG: translocation/assembly module TamB [Bacteroides sp.]|nr:translocation/assembly module TamB [Bacteroides sp.]